MNKTVQHQKVGTSVRSHYQSGQTIILVLMLMLVGLVVITAAMSLAITGEQTTLQVEQSQRALLQAESGIENAMLRLLRDPSYSGETLTLSGGNVTITVVGSDPKVITATSRVGSSVKVVQTSLTYPDGQATVSAWTEVYE